jgi:hypothetical protein
MSPEDAAVVAAIVGLRLQAEEVLCLVSAQPPDHGRMPTEATTDADRPPAHQGHHA